MRRTEKNRGAAMVIVLCVMVVFLALSTTIILAGSVALNTARNNVIYERKVQASSLSELFVGDLVGRDISDESSSLLRYVRDGIVKDGWPTYDEKKDRDEQAEGAVRIFTMDTGEGDAREEHQITIEMYWTWDGAASEHPTEEDEKNDVIKNKNVCLYVDVISTLNDIEYHVKRKFNLTATPEISGAAPDAAYPCKWNWSAVGRSPDRGKDGGA